MIHLESRHTSPYVLHRHRTPVPSSLVGLGLRWLKSSGDEDISTLPATTVVRLVALTIPLLDPGLGHVGQERGDGLSNTALVPV